MRSPGGTSSTTSTSRPWPLSRGPMTIAQGHGGRLELETAEGHGSVFRLVLPEAGGGPPLPGRLSP
ncbi:hypothetical protein ABZ016_31150 [Streptomyces sp. NPDC006372]|uniref:hypothetical protein n=1 Tax=Streptomyces sp. NPDC006372 TaxID=3155599 RepID=UPI0033AD6232